MAIFTTTGARIFIGPAQADDLTKEQYLAIDNAAHAQGTYHFTALPADGASIVIKGVTISFVDTLTTGLQALIGQSIPATLQNLLHVIEESTDADLLLSTYSLEAEETTLRVTAKVEGVGGNAYTTTASSSPASNATVSGATLSGGGGTGWVEIDEASNLGAFGDTSASVTFSSIKDARVRKMKGARDAGNISLVCGYDARDLGQIAMRLAQTTKFYYAFKVIAADERLEDDTPTTFFFNALVDSEKVNFGANNAVVQTTFTIGINTDIIEVPGAPA
jgi:hypothetical protein